MNRSRVSLLTFLLLSLMLFADADVNCSEPVVPSDFNISICCRLPKINLGEERVECQEYVQSLRLPQDPAIAAYAHMCFSECIYKKTGALVDGEIVLDNVKSFLEKNVEETDVAIVPHIVNAFDTCITSIKSHMKNVGIDLKDQLPVGCSPYPGLVYGCVDAETFLNCPTDMWKSDEPNCEAARNYGKECNPLPHVPLPLPVAHDGQ